MKKILTLLFRFYALGDLTQSEWQLLLQIGDYKQVFLKRDGGGYNSFLGKYMHQVR